MTSTGRGRGRPSQPAVTRDAISRAALDIAREDGYEKLTMAALARRLGVAPSALYNHISNKAELLVLLQDAVMGQVHTESLHAAAAGELPVAEALRRWARSYRDVFARHTPLVQVIATMPVAGASRTREMYDAVAAALFHSSLPDSEVMPRVIALESFIYGSAFDANAPAHIFADTPEDSPLASLSRATAAFHPVPAAESGDESASNPFALRPFEVGLERLLADL